MTQLLALLSRLKPALPWIAEHWRLVSVAVLSIVAALALRGCASERSRADGAEAQASAANARLAAEFEGALQSVRGLSVALSRRIDASGAQPVAVFVATSAHQTVPPLPAAPDSGQRPPAASTGSPTLPSAKPEPSACVLAVGDGFEFHLSGAELKAKDGGHLVLADVSLDADNGLHLSAVVEAPVTLPPVDLAPSLDAVKLPSGWGFGATGALGDRGWAAGPAVALPPLRFWGFEANATLGATFGPGGAQGLASVTVRR